MCITATQQYPEYALLHRIYAAIAGLKLIPIKDDTADEN